jgi:hypothetical protein
MTHAYGALPRIGEVLPLDNGLHRQICRQQVHTFIISNEVGNRHIRIKVNKIEGNGD